MKSLKKFSGFIFILVIALIFTACESVPDNCGDGSKYDPETQFCFGGRAYDRCGGGDYNPNTQACQANTLYNKCEDGSLIALGARCGEFSLATNAVPATGGNIIRTPDGDSYPAGEEVAVTASALGGHTFIGWAGSLTSSSQTVTLTMDRNKPLVAMFVPANDPSASSYALITAPTQTAGGTMLVNGTAQTGETATTHNRDTPVTVTAEPKEGYTFTGWSGTVTSTEKEITVTMDGNQVLVANFRHNDDPDPDPVYTLIVSALPGGSVTGGGAYTAGMNAHITATPNEGYRFAGWMPTAGVASPNAMNTTVAMTADRTILAQFEVGSSPCAGLTAATPGSVCCEYDPAFNGCGSGTSTTYTLTINAPNGGTVFVNDAETTGNAPHDSGATISVRAEAAEGYTFTGWAGASTSTNAAITIRMLGDRTLTANFVVGFTDERDGKVYRTVKIGDLTWMAENLNYQTGNSSCYADENSRCNTHGRLYSRDTAMVVCPVGWRLPVRQDWDDLAANAGGRDIAGRALKSQTGWSGSGNGTDDFGFSAMPGGQLLSSHFQNFNSQGYWWSASDTTISYFDGTGVSRERHILYQYMHVGNNVSEGLRNFQSNGSSTRFSVRCVQGELIELITPTHTLTVNTNPTDGGTVSRDPNLEEYQDGATVTVTAMPNDGYRFTGWSDASTSTDAEITVTMDGDKALTANFEVIVTYTLAVDAHPAGGGTVSRDPDLERYQEGAAVTIRALPSDGYIFTGWTPTDGIASPNAATTTVSMTEGRTVTANFTPGFIDARDRQSYRIVTIGVGTNARTWMAENLNFQTTNSACYDRSASNCEVYGRLYSRGDAMSACPAGWRLPAEGDWTALLNSAGGQAAAGTRLRAASGWTGADLIPGTDNLGFSALPGGISGQPGGGSFSGIGSFGSWWSTVMVNNYPRFYLMESAGESVRTSANNSWCSVRCVRN